MSTEEGDAPTFEDEEAEDVLFGGGGDGSSGFSFGGGGGGGNPSQFFRSILLGMRINPIAFRDIIGVAGQEGWSSEEFMWAVSNSQPFQRMFPGINALFQQGMSFGTAVSTWRRMAEEYRGVAKALGLGHLARLTPNRVGFLIRRGVDVEEFQLRLSILNIAKKSEPFRETFNQLLTDYGHEKLDKQGWYKFLMGHADKRIYDLYEAASLFQQLGAEGLRLREAKQLARAVGPSGVPADLSEVLSQVGQVQDALGSQQLADAGISAKDMALAVLRDQLNSPARKRAADRIATQIEQMVLNRQASETAIDRQATFVVGQDRPISSAAPTGELAG